MAATAGLAVTRQGRPVMRNRLTRERILQAALAMLFCGGCDTDAQFALGADLMIRGLAPQASPPS